MSSLSTSSMYQLTMTRFRLFLREPEAIFRIFVFPILLAVGLGIAFRNRPADVLQVGATTSQLTSALDADKVQFQISQRAEFFEEIVGLETTLKRRSSTPAARTGTPAGRKYPGRFPSR